MAASLECIMCEDQGSLLTSQHHDHGFPLVHKPSSLSNHWSLVKKTTDAQETLAEGATPQHLIFPETSCHTLLKDVYQVLATYKMTLKWPSDPRPALSQISPALFKSPVPFAFTSYGTHYPPHSLWLLMMVTWPRKPLLLLFLATWPWLHHRMPWKSVISSITVTSVITKSHHGAFLFWVSWVSRFLRPRNCYLPILLTELNTLQCNLWKPLLKFT